jgi:hypothetical protein
MRYMALAVFEPGLQSYTRLWAHSPGSMYGPPQQRLSPHSKQRPLFATSNVQRYRTMFKIMSYSTAQALLAAGGRSIAWNRAGLGHSSSKGLHMARVQDKETPTHS